MSPLLIAQILEALASAATSAYNLYEQSKDTMSATDLAVIHAALVKAQQATNDLRPQVDAALEAASKV